MAGVVSSGGEWHRRWHVSNGGIVAIIYGRHVESVVNRSVHHHRRRNTGGGNLSSSLASITRRAYK